MNYFMKILFALSTAIVILMTTGCSPMAKIAVTKPADINLEGINKVVMGNIKGNRGFDMQNMITDELFASQRYDVIDRATFDRISRQQNFSLNSDISEDQAQKASNVLGKAVMVTGSSYSDFKYRRGTKRYTDRNGMPHTKNTVEAKLKLLTKLSVIELATGRVMGVKNIQKEDKRTTSALDRWATPPDANEMVEPLIKQTAAEFMHMIAPYVSYVYVNFEDAVTPDGEQGIELAQVGQWSESIPAFLRESISTSSAASWHNLGLAYQYSFQFDDAKNAFRKCIGIEALDGCIKGLRNVDIMIRDEKRLKIQGAQ